MAHDVYMRRYAKLYDGTVLQTLFPPPLSVLSAGL